MDYIRRRMWRCYFLCLWLLRRIGKSEELCMDLMTVKNKVKYFIQHEDESWMVDLVSRLLNLVQVAS